MKNDWDKQLKDVPNGSVVETSYCLGGNKEIIFVARLVLSIVRSYGVSYHFNRNEFDLPDVLKPVIGNEDTFFVFESRPCKIINQILNSNQKCMICNISCPHSIPNKHNNYICRFCSFAD